MPDTTVHTLLTSVEALPAEACGAYVIEQGDLVVAYVFVEANRVCWAGASRLRKRLRELLRDQLADNTPRGVAMRAALERHSIESLLSLPQDQGERVTWVPHPEGYRPRFTFAPIDLFVAANAYLYTSESRGAESALAMVPPETRAASFVTGDDGALVAVRTAGLHQRIAELDDLATWAGAAFGIATNGFSPAVMRRSITNGTGAVTIAWQTSRTTTHAAVFDRGPALEEFVLSLERRGLPAVVGNQPQARI